MLICFCYGKLFYGANEFPSAEPSNDPCLAPQTQSGRSCLFSSRRYGSNTDYSKNLKNWNSLISAVSRGSELCEDGSY